MNAPRATCPRRLIVTPEEAARKRAFGFNLRPGERNNRGRIATVVGAAPVTPLTILGSLSWWVRSDSGITIGTGVSAWADQSGNAVDFSQGTGGSQPAYAATGGPNGGPIVTGDGVDDILRATHARVAPLTQPFFVWCVFRAESHTLNDVVVGDLGAPGYLFRQAASPNYYMYDAVIGNTVALATATWARAEMQFTGSVADYLKIGSTSVNGTSSGNSAGGGTVALFGSPSGIQLANVSLVEAFEFAGTPTGPQRAALDAYCTAKYSAAVSV